MIEDLEYRHGELWMLRNDRWEKVDNFSGAPPIVSPLPPTPSPARFELAIGDLDHLPDSMSGKQARFLACFSALVLHINTSQARYYATGGDLFRDARVFGEYGEAAPCASAYGIRSSNHKLRLAGDINALELATGQLAHGSEAHRPWAEHWEALGRRLGFPLRSGIRFGDANHYEWQTGWTWEPLP